MRVESGLLEQVSAGLAECLDRLAANKRENRPLSTYRLQFNHSFRFADAQRLVPYLRRLGVSHIYASPILAARPASLHGYDITDHDNLNPEIGSYQELEALVAELRRNGMALMLDTVPNHMGIGFGFNPWWMDVLENGRTAEHADYFDIDWQPLKRELHEKILLPILGEQYGAELEAGKIRVEFREGFLRVLYYDKMLPLDPQTLPMVLEADGNIPEELRRLAGEFRSLPKHFEITGDAVDRRRARAPHLLQRLRDALEASPALRDSLDRALKELNGSADDPASFDALHRLLEAQVYRLAHWRVSAEEINYRRFFDVNDLIGLRMENPSVFAATHKLMRRLLAEGLVSGVRIDHCDGLLNPRQYLVRLQMLYAASQCGGPEPQLPLAENGIELEVQQLFGQHNWVGESPPLFTVVEKILEPGEVLPSEWPVDGTTGYEFGALVNGLFIQKRSEKAFTQIYQRFIGQAIDPRELVYYCKKLIMNTALSSEVNVLMHILDEISSCNRRARDFTRKALGDAIRETIACFPVYRSYIDERGKVRSRDQEYVEIAIRQAKRRNADTAEPAFDFLRDVLLLRPNPNGESEGLYRQKMQFTLKFQQLTGPVMAKGLEDTASYIYNRFVSVNEVGGAPHLFGTTLEEFHHSNEERANLWPFSMLNTSTHDTKRSEDVRARLNVLSEMPRPWTTQVLRWRRTNRTRKVTIGDGRVVPDANEEYLFYQTLLGAWPFSIADGPERKLFTDRIVDYMTKAVHEAKVNLSWVNENPEYIGALTRFIHDVLAPAHKGKPNPFLKQIEDFLPPIRFFGALNSLAQTLLKITSPGLPDIYQGCDLWDFSLVDPDNRRAVDFAQRSQMLKQLESQSSGCDLTDLCADMLSNVKDGRLKLWTTYRSLGLRRDHPELFRSGQYDPQYATGDKREHVCAFSRSLNGSDHSKARAAITVVPRFAYTMMNGRMQWPLGEAWGDAELSLPPSSSSYFENVFTRENIRPTPRRTLLCRDVFASFPIALLLGR